MNIEFDASIVASKIADRFREKLVVRAAIIAAWGDHKAVRIEDVDKASQELQRGFTL